MKRRVFLGFVLASAPAKSIASDRLKGALDELEKAARAAYGEVRFEVSLDENKRAPLMVQAWKPRD